MTTTLDELDPRLFLPVDDITEETLSRIAAAWASSEKKPEVISFEMGVVKVLRARKSSGGTGLPAAQTYKAWDQQDRTGLNHLLRLAKTSEAGGGRLSGRKVRLLATAWVDGELLVDLKSFELQVTAKSTQLLGTAAERSTRASIEDESYHVVRTGEGLEVQWRFKTKEQFAEWATGVLNLLYDPDNNSGAAEGDGKQLLGILETLAGISGGVERINQRSHKLVMRIKAKVVHAKNSLASMVPTLTNSATTLLLEWRDAAEERFDLLEGRVTGVEKGLEEERRTRAAETEEIRRRLDEKDELDAARDALLNQHGARVSELEAEQQAQLARVDKLQGEQQALAAQFVETKAKNTLKMAQLQAQLQAQLRDEEEAGKKALEQITRKQSSLFEMIQADKATAAKLAAKIKQLNKNQEAEKMARAAGDAKAKEHADAAVEEAAAKQSATDADVQELDRQMMRATTRLKGAANKLESKVAAQGKVLKETVQAVSNLKDDDNDSLFNYSEDGNGDGEARDVDLSDLEVPTTPAASSGPPPEVPDTKELRRKGLLDVTNKDCVGA